jgi:uncharacterized protein YbjT (DUF2867 family)
MKVVVLGATGATGREVVNQALDAAHHVVAYGRRPEAIQTRPGLDVVAGQLDDVEPMKSAFCGADTVICCVGPKLDLHALRHVDLMQRTLPQIVAAMHAVHVDPALICKDKRQ